MASQNYILSDFSGGVTDYYVDTALNKYQKADNLLITPNKKLLSRPGSEVYDTAYAQIPVGAQRIGAVISLDSESIFYVQSARNIYYMDSGWQALTGPSTNPALPSGTTSNYISYAVWNHHLIITNDSIATPMKVYKDGTTLKVRNAGLPALASTPTVTAGAAGANSYVYAFAYAYEYQVGATGSQVQFLDVGSFTYVDLDNAAAPNLNAVAITVIPVLANGATENYDTSNIKVHIYRTENAGTEFYKVGEVTNGTTTFNDNVSDATLITNLPIYTSGGVVENDPPPKSKYVHVVNRICYYGHVQEGSEIKTNRVRQSLPDDPDSCPETFYDEVEDEITGLSSTNGVPIVFGKTHTYRLDGVIDELGRGAITHQEISATIGCISAQSIVQVQQGVVFAGNDGFYFTDGYQVQKISDGLNDTYKLLTNTTLKQKNIQGAFDRINNRVYWTIQRDDASLDNDACIVLDLRWGVRADSSFTFIQGGDSFAPTGIAFYSNDLLRADKRGYLFRHDESIFSDPVVDTTTSAVNWAEQAIIYNLTTHATNFGFPYVRSWVSKVLFTCENITNLSLQLYSINNDSGIEKALVPLRFRQNCIWGDAEPVWGDSTAFWNFDGLIEEQRRFPAGGLRCSYKQVVLTNAYSVITNSDTRGTATVDNTANTALLNNSAEFDWPGESLGYYLSFANDSYEKQYLVTNYSADTLTFQDAANNAPTGSQAWLLKGYPKNEVIKVLSLNIEYSPFSDSKDSYTGGTTLGNNA